MYKCPADDYLFQNLKINAPKPLRWLRFSVVCKKKISLAHQIVNTSTSLNIKGYITQRACYKISISLTASEHDTQCHLVSKKIGKYDGLGTLVRSDGQ